MSNESEIKYSFIFCPRHFGEHSCIHCEKELDALKRRNKQLQREREWLVRGLSSEDFRSFSDFQRKEALSPEQEKNGE